MELGSDEWLDLLFKVLNPIFRQPFRSENLSEIINTEGSSLNPFFQQLKWRLLGINICTCHYFLWESWEKWKCCTFEISGSGLNFPDKNVSHSLHYQSKN